MCFSFLVGIVRALYHTLSLGSMREMLFRLLCATLTCIVWIYFEEQQKEKSTYRTCSHINKCIHKRGTPITFQFYVTIILTPLIRPTSTRIRLCVTDSAAIAAAATAFTVVVDVASVVVVVVAKHICGCSWLHVYMMLLLMIMKRVREKERKKNYKTTQLESSSSKPELQSFFHRMKKSLKAARKKQQQEKLPTTNI